MQKKTVSNKKILVACDVIIHMQTRFRKKHFSNQHLKSFENGVLSYRHLKLYVWLESVLVSIFYVYLQWEFKINKVFAIRNSVFNCYRFMFKIFNYYNGSFV